MENNSSFKSILLKNTFWIYFFGYMTALLAYGSKLIYGKSLSVELFGLVYALIGFFVLISVFNDFGFSDAIIYFGVKYYERKDLYSLKFLFVTAFLNQLLLSLFFIFIMYILSPLILEKYFKVQIDLSIFFIFFLYFISLNFSKTIQNFFIIKNNFFLPKLYLFLQFLLVTVLSFLLLTINKLNLYYISLIWSIPFFILTLIFFIVLLYHYVELKKIKYVFDLKHYKKIYKYAFSIFIGISAMIIITKIDIYFIIYYLDLFNVGIYEVLLTIVSIIPTFIGPISTLILSTSTRLIELKKLNELSYLITQIYKVYMLIAIPLGSLFIVFANELIQYLFSVNFLVGAQVLKIPVITAILSLFFSINYNLLLGMGKVKKRNLIIYFSALLNLFLNFLLVVYFKLELFGIALATLISISIMFWFTMRAIVENGISILISKLYLLKIIFLNIIFYYSLIFFKNNLFFNFVIFGLNLSLLIKLFLILFISGLIYLILARIFNLYSFDEILKLIKNKK